MSQMSIEEAQFNVVSRQQQAFARREDPQTSHEAAASVKDLSRVQKEILHILRWQGPSSDTRISDWYAGPLASEQSLRSRRRELVIAGLVRDSGRRGKTASGRACVIWELVPHESQP